MLRFARENRSLGYGRIIRALAIVGTELCADTVVSVHNRHDIGPAPAA